MSKIKAEAVAQVKSNYKDGVCRAERVVLAVIKPHGGDLTKGYTFALQTKKHLQLLGEIALARSVNKLAKDKPSKVEKISVKSLDYAEVLATGYAFCRSNNYVPCKAINEYGAGAQKLVKARDIIKSRMAALNASKAKAEAALIEAATSGKRADLKKAASEASEASKAAKEYEEKTFRPAMKKYREEVAKAVAVLAAMEALRKE